MNKNACYDVETSKLKYLDWIPKSASLLNKSKHLINSSTIACLLFTFALTNSSLALAQYGGPPVGDPIRFEDHYTTGVTHKITAHNKDLMGDAIDLDTGALSFKHVDLDLPGNFGIPVRFGRTAGQTVLSQDQTKMFGDWTPLIPHIRMRVASSTNASTHTRCTNPSSASAYSNGVGLYIEGNRKEVLKPTGATPSFPGTTVPDLLTKDYWRIDCSTRSNGTGQAFVAKSPSGTIYNFKYLIEYSAGSFNRPNKPSAAMKNAVYYPSRIQDKYGNWVDYSYNSIGPTRIEASDGRLIEIIYDSNQRISEVKAGSRSWTYTYNSSSGRLSQVTLPDNRKWQFGSMNIGQGSERYFCPQYSGYADVTHPDGTRGQFYASRTPNTRSRVPPPINALINNACIPQPNPWPTAGYDYSYMSLATTLKKLTLSDGEIQEWNYTYHNKPYYNATVEGRWDYFNDQDKKKRTVIGPTGVKTEYDINRAFGWQEGLTHEIRIYPNASSTMPIKTIKNDYDVITGIGTDYTGGASSLGTGSKNLMTGSETLVDGDTFTKSYEYNAYGHKTYGDSSSNVSTTPRGERTTYVYDFPNWRFPMVTAKTLETGSSTLPTTTYSYNSNDDVSEEKHFGQTRTTFTYHSGGQIHTVADALNRTITLSDYYRGVPRNVKRPDQVSLTRTVNNFGQATSETDAMGRSTSYEYNDIGRLTKITPAGGFTPTTITYQNGNGLVQTVTNGQSRITITRDSMLRKILERTQALDTGWSTYVNTEYDTLGRVLFKSQPSSSATHNQGVANTYDGLGRIKTQTETVSGAQTIHSYYNSHRHTIRDPESNYKHFYSFGYGGPGNQDYRGIYESTGGRYTIIYKSLWGEITQVRQKGHGGNAVDSKDHREYFYYDSQRRLCRTYRKEQGATRYQYDDAGQLIAFAKGQSNSGCGVIQGSTARVSLGYDNLGRLETTNFQDSSTPDIVRGYNANGSLLSVNRGSGANAVNWAYSYHPNADLLTSETLTLDNRSFGLSYSYNNAQHLTRRTFPSGRYVDYTPDGLGRDRTAKYGSTYYANNIGYHASGQTSGLTYGNGHVFTQTFNNRLLPQRRMSVKGGIKAFDQTYSYDQRGKVTSIIDGAVSANNRSFTYDALGQLKTSTGPWGTQTNNYDSLGNVISRAFSGGGVGSRTIDLQYDTNNRVYQSIDSQATGTGIGGTGIRTVGYDTRGNVTTLGTIGFTYDYSDQPTVMTGSLNGTNLNTASYEYDGNLKRVKSVINGKTIYNVYDAAGALAYIYEPSGDRKTDYIHAGGMLIAQRDRVGTPTYVHTDHLGSPVQESTTSGALQNGERFMPYGLTMNNPSAHDDKLGFTGHIKDSATGLNYMQARYYDPLMGRFLSIDPVTFVDLPNPAQFNRYAYTWNDPINGTDPDGMQTCQQIGYCGGSQSLVAPHAQAGTSPEPSENTVAKRQETDENDQESIGDYPWWTSTQQVASGTTSLNRGAVTAFGENAFGAYKIRVFALGAPLSKPAGNLTKLLEKVKAFAGIGKVLSPKNAIHITVSRRHWTGNDYQLTKVVNVTRSFEARKTQYFEINRQVGGYFIVSVQGTNSAPVYVDIEKYINPNKIP